MQEFPYMGSGRSVRTLAPSGRDGPPFRGVRVLYLFGPEGPPIWGTEVWMSAWIKRSATRATVQ